MASVIRHNKNITAMTNKQLKTLVTNILKEIDIKDFEYRKELNADMAWRKEVKEAVAAISCLESVKTRYIPGNHGASIRSLYTTDEINLDDYLG